MTKPTNEEYIHGILKGDSKIIKALYEDVGKSIIAHILNNSGTVTDGEDYFRMAVIKTRTKLNDPNMDNIDNITGFIFGVARNDWLSNLRSKKKKQELFNQNKPIEDYYDLKSEEPTVEERIVKDEKVQSVYNNLKKLSEKCRELLQMHFFQQMRLVHIAEELDTKEGTIRKRKLTCLKELKKLVLNTQRP